MSEFRLPSPELGATQSSTVDFSGIDLADFESDFGQNNFCIDDFQHQNIDQNKENQCVLVTSFIFILFFPLFLSFCSQLLQELYEVFRKRIQRQGQIFSNPAYNATVILNTFGSFYFSCSFFFLNLTQKQLLIASPLIEKTHTYSNKLVCIDTKARKMKKLSISPTKTVFLSFSFSSFSF